MRKEIYFGYNHMEVQRLVALPSGKCLLYGDTIPKWIPDVLSRAHPVFLSLCPTHTSYILHCLTPLP